DHDLFVVGGHGVLALTEEFFEEFFAVAEAGEDDVDVLAGFESGEKNHLLREVEYADGLSHVEEEDLAAVAHDRGFEDELTRLGNGHKVARDFRMGDGNWTALIDLFLKNGDNGSVGAQDVSEACSNEGRMRLGKVLKV